MPENDGITLLFVYNADSGLLHELADYVHKMVSPQTYQCNLCAVTYSTTGMKKEWKPFITSLGVPVEFLHRDEFLDTYSIKAHFPAVFVKEILHYSLITMK